MQTNYENALSFIESYGWNDEKLRKAENIIPLIATMLELYSKGQELKQNKKHFIEVKVVAENLNTCRELIKEFSSNGFTSDGVIQENGTIYWTFLNKNVGLLELEPNVKL